MSTPQTYELGWLSYLSNILFPHWPKSGGQKNFLLASLTEFVPTFKTVVPPLFTSEAVCCVCVIKPTTMNHILNIKQSHGLWRSAGLKMPNHAHFFRLVILTPKIGQTDLVFGMQSGYISMSVHARLQVSVCSGCSLFYPVNIQTDFRTQRACDQLIW